MKTLLIDSVAFSDCAAQETLVIAPSAHRVLQPGEIALHRAGGVRSGGAQIRGWGIPNPVAR